MTPCRSLLFDGFQHFENIRTRWRTLWDWLASDGGVSVTDDVECADLIAGKPAPTGFVVSGLKVNSGIHRPGVDDLAATHHQQITELQEDGFGLVGRRKT